MPDGSIPTLQLFMLAETSESTVNAPPLDEHQVLVLLVQLSLLVLVARLLGGVFKRMGQPPVVGELLAGVILGPPLFRQVAPEAYAWVFEAEPVVNSSVFAFAWLGVIMLLVVIGFETDLAIIGRFRRASLLVSAGSLLIPFGVGVALATAAPSEFRAEGASVGVFAGFFALALSVSALPVVAKILQDLGFLRRNFGQITLASGMTMDSFGWLILAALAGIARENRLDLGSLGRSIGGLAVFLLFSVTVGRWFIDRLYRRIMSMGSSVTAALTITLLAALIGAAVTQWLGLEAILGAFIVGILLSTTRHQLPKVRERLETFTTAFFAPIFFAFSGLRVDLSALRDTQILLWAIGIVVAALLAKVVGTYVGARLGGIGHREGLALGSGLSALGAMGIVVALVGLNVGELSESGYTVLVVAAIVTSIVSPALLRLTVSGWEVPPEEKARLQREALRESSVILHSRRALVPTRGGRNSRYAARLIEAVFDELEVSVLAVDVPTPGWIGRFLLRRRAGSSVGVAEIVEVFDTTVPRVVRKVDRDPADAIAQETRLGYDLLVLGASDGESDSGLFSTVVDRVLSQSPVPSIVVRFPADFDAPDRLPHRILIPVNASIATRAAEEFGYSIARATEGSVVALHVINRPDGQGMMLEEQRMDDAKHTGTELLTEATILGSRLGVKVGTLLQVAANTEQEIVTKANSGEFDMLVLGVAQRPLTNRSFFGHRVNYIIENAQIPVAIVGLPTNRPSGG